MSENYSSHSSRALAKDGTGKTHAETGQQDRWESRHQSSATKGLKKYP